MKKNTYFKNNKETAKETAKYLLKNYPEQINLGSEDFTRALESGAKYVTCNQFGIIEPANEVGKHYEMILNPSFSDIEVDFENVEQKNRNTKDDRRKRIDHIFSIIDFEIDPDKLTKIIQVIDHDNKHGDKSTYEMYLNLK